MDGCTRYKQVKTTGWTFVIQRHYWPRKEENGEFCGLCQKSLSDTYIFLFLVNFDGIYNVSGTSMTVIHGLQYAGNNFLPMLSI